MKWKEISKQEKQIRNYNKCHSMSIVQIDCSDDKVKKLSFGLGRLFFCWIVWLGNQPLNSPLPHITLEMASSFIILWLLNQQFPYELKSPVVLGPTCFFLSFHNLKLIHNPYYKIIPPLPTQCCPSIEVHKSADTPA